MSKYKLFDEFVSLKLTFKNQISSESNYAFSMFLHSSLFPLGDIDIIYFMEGSNSEVAWQLVE